jgi:hypothetical protein
MPFIPCVPLSLILPFPDKEGCTQYGSLDIELSHVQEERPILPSCCDFFKASSSVFTWSLVALLTVIALLGAADWESIVLMAPDLFSARFQATSVKAGNGEVNKSLMSEEDCDVMTELL